MVNISLVHGVINKRLIGSLPSRQILNLLRARRRQCFVIDKWHCSLVAAVPFSAKSVRPRAARTRRLVCTRKSKPRTVTSAVTTGDARGLPLINKIILRF